MTLVRLRERSGRPGYSAWLQRLANAQSAGRAACAYHRCIIATSYNNKSTHVRSGVAGDASSCICVCMCVCVYVYVCVYTQVLFSDRQCRGI